MKKNTKRFEIVFESVTTLTLTDNNKLRDIAEKDCKKFLSKIDKVKEEMRIFETIDKPSYTKWFNLNFYDMMNRTREKIQELESKRSLVEEVYDIAFFKKVSFPEAYRIVQESIEAEKAEELKIKKSDENPEIESDDSFAEEDEAFREDLNEFYKNFHKKKSSKEKGEVGKTEARIKEKYRNAALKLHPDKNKNPTHEEKDLWNDIQEAYKNKDEEKLDFLIQNFNLRKGKSFFQSSIYELRQTKLRLEKSLKSFQKKLKLLKKDPAWCFDKKTITVKNKLKTEIERDLLRAEREVSKDLVQLSNLVESWKLIYNERKKMNRKPTMKEEDLVQFYINY